MGEGNSKYATSQKRMWYFGWRAFTQGLTTRNKKPSDTHQILFIYHNKHCKLKFGTNVQVYKEVTIHYIPGHQEKLLYNQAYILENFLVVVDNLAYAQKSSRGYNSIVFTDMDVNILSDQLGEEWDTEDVIDQG